MVRSETNAVQKTTRILSRVFHNMLTYFRRIIQCTLENVDIEKVTKRLMRLDLAYFSINKCLFFVC